MLIAVAIAEGQPFVTSDEKILALDIPGFIAVDTRV
jgi:hypothetical protein